MKSPKDVLELGRAIVRELELEARGKVLERWLAHHLAELMAEADRAIGLEKAPAERQVVDLILRLWSRREEMQEAAALRREHSDLAFRAPWMRSVMLESDPDEGPTGDISNGDSGKA